MRTRFRWTTATIVVPVALFGFAMAAQTTNVTQTKQLSAQEHLRADG